MNIQANFVKGATKVADFPQSNMPEAAFAGRSNVGKSSLLNSIVRRNNLARISATPGKTQEINFFSVEDRWMLADLPGFGYASAPKTQREYWLKLNYEYLLGREQLRVVFILSDSRHDPQPIELELMERMENAGRKFVVILTKCDKISAQMEAERVEQLRSVTQYCKGCIDVLPYSARLHKGRENLWGIIKREVA
ncbi:ribosome biogenesis GTP-binding protein YihA/YsxC [Ignavibacteria bacterium]|nr:YihA family ribosome biogenesis GTP-binding protein [Bacteroidota bacterium]MCZ2131653.1 ribosome biogenesis GTP-binding protein YihA/YsxC [Bacteroidota bacterium]